MYLPFAIQWSRYLVHLNRYLATVLIAMTPIGELRAALPVANQSFNIPLPIAYVLSVVGNMIPVFFLLWLLEPVSRWLMAHSRIFDRYFNWLFARTRRKLDKKYEIYAEIALAIFVAIPLPGTGAWTGSVAAFLFDIPYRKALFWIFVGVLGAGLIVSAVMGMSVGVLKIFNW